MPPEDDSALERLRSRLYSPNSEPPPLTRSDLPKEAPPIPRGWAPPPPPKSSTTTRPPRQKLPVAVRFLIGAGIFFGIATLLTAYFLFWGGNSVSTNNIYISVDGPTSASGGDTVPLLITIENHNPVSISDTSLTVDFPDGTRSAEDVTEPLARYTDSLGDMPAGQAVTRTVSAVLFGSENQTITIPITIEYKTANSNAVFVKEKDYTITITSSPVSVNATSVTEISSGQPFSVSLSVRSNATKPLSAIALKAEYPFGFTVSSTSIPSNNGLFNFGTIQPGEEKKLTITGSLTGGDNDARVFHWSVGSTASSTNGTIGVTYATTISSITITQPFFNIALSLNGNANDNISVSGGQNVQGLLKWTNTLSSEVLDGQITITLSGSGFDPTSVVTQNGFYQSSNQTIRFDRDTNNALADLQPGDTGTGSFSFNIKSADQLAQLRNPTVTLSVSASGRRVAEAGVPESLSATLTRTLKIASGLTVSSRLVHTTGPFNDTGPWPPTHGQPTQYTVMLSASNNVNTVAGASVSMTLPSYVTFTGLTNPADGSVSYSDSTRTVKWTIGDMPSGSSKSAAFQVSFLPSVSQVGSSPQLISTQTITGTDRFTQSVVTATAPALDTHTTTDPAYQNQDGIVQ